MSFSFRKKILVSLWLTFWSNCGNEWLCKAAHYLYVDLHVISAENVEILCKMLDGAGTCWWRTPRIYHRRPGIFRHWQYKSQFLLNNRPEIVDSMVGCGLEKAMRIWAIQKIQKNIWKLHYFERMKQIFSIKMSVYDEASGNWKYAHHCYIYGCTYHAFRIECPNPVALLIHFSQDRKIILHFTWFP